MPAQKLKYVFNCRSHAIFSSIRELSARMKHCKHHSGSQKSASQQKPLSTLQMLPKQHLCFWVSPWKTSRNYVQLVVRRGKQPFLVIKFILIFLPLPSFHLYSGLKEIIKMIEDTSFFPTFLLLNNTCSTIEMCVVGISGQFVVWLQAILKVIYIAHANNQ